MGTIGARLGESGRAFASVFTNPALRRINVANAASVIGDSAYAVAVAVWAYEEGGAAAVGVFGVLRYLSMALLAPLFATLADRHERRLVMIGSDLSSAAVIVVGAVLIAADGPPVAIYAAGLLAGVLSLAFRPAEAALLPEVATDPRELTSANVVSSTIESVGFFAGPVLGAVLLAVADVPIVYLVNALTFVVSAAFLVGLRVPDRARVADVEPGGGEPEPRAGIWHETVAGFRTIGSRRDLRLICALMTAQTVVAGASLVFEVSIALDLLDLGESGVGLLGAALGVGGIVGGFVALVAAARGRIATDFGIGVLLWSAPLLLIVAAPFLGPTLLVMATIGVANAVVDINAYTIIQRLAPPDVMGRVFGALESMLTAGMALGALLMPLLIATIGLRPGLAIIGGAVAALALAGLPALRRIDTTVLAPPDLELLRGVPMLAMLPPPTLERLAHLLVTMTVPAGTPVIDEGDVGDRFWIVAAGLRRGQHRGRRHPDTPRRRHVRRDRPAARRAADGVRARRRRRCGAEGPRTRRLPPGRDRARRGTAGRRERRRSLAGPRLNRARPWARIWARSVADRDDPHPDAWSRPLRPVRWDAPAGR